MKELMIALQSGRETPLYEQIYLAIRREIEDGKISCGEKLPSTRLLAGNLAVSRFTVDQAYEQLVSEGYIESRPGSGYYVCDLADLLSGSYDADTEYPASGGRAGAKIIECNDFYDNDKNEHLAISQDRCIDFSPFAIDAEYFPYNIWKKRNREAIEEAVDQKEKILTVRDAKGDTALREAIATYLHRARGVHCEPGQVLIGAGNEYLLLLLTQILGTNKKLAMEKHTYLQAAYVMQHAGWQIASAASDEDGILPDALRRQAADVAYVMPSHQFPVGVVMPLRRRRELLDWACEAEDRYLIEDDHDSEFRYIGKPIPSLQGSDHSERVIYIGTFSKAIAPSLRMSYMVLPPHLSDRFERELSFYSATVSSQLQRSVYHFMVQGDFERHLNRMRRVYKSKHDFLLKELKSRSWVHQILGANAGMHLVVEINTSLTEKQMLEKAAIQGVKLYGLEQYSLATDSDMCYPTLILGFGGLSEEEMLQGMKVMDSFL